MRLNKYVVPITFLYFFFLSSAAFCQPKLANFEKLQSGSNNLVSEQLNAKILELTKDTSGGTEAIADRVASLSTGHIPIELTAERLALQEKYPIQVPTDKDIASLQSNTHRSRLHSAILLIGDFDPRSAGFIGSEYVAPTSLSGLMAARSLSEMRSKRLSRGAEINEKPLQDMRANLADAAMSQAQSYISNPAASPVPNASVGANLVGGIIAGYLIGAMVTREYQSTFDDMVKSYSFGDVMQRRSLSTVNKAINLQLNGALHIHVPTLEVFPQVYRYYFAVDPDSTNRVPVISVHAFFRGSTYLRDYPQTLGWEFVISNLNYIDLPMSAINKREAFFRLLTEKISTNEIRL